MGNAVAIDMSTAKVLRAIAADQKKPEIVMELSRAIEASESWDLPKAYDQLLDDTLGKDLNEGYVIMPMGTAAQLRDWFAGQAPSMPDWWLSQCLNRGNEIIKLDAAWRYAWADAMLAERDKKKE